MSVGNIFGVFNISASGMSAQRKSLQTRAENLANAESVDKTTGEPYKKKEVQLSSQSQSKFAQLIQESRIALVRRSNMHIPGIRSVEDYQPESGVASEIVESNDQETKLIYSPEHPNANEEGYVEVADIDSIDEMVKLMAAARAYEANATVMSAAKDMFKKALEI